MDIKRASQDSLIACLVFALQTSALENLVQLFNNAFFGKLVAFKHKDSVVVLSYTDFKKWMDENMFFVTSDDVTTHPVVYAFRDEYSDTSYESEHDAAVYAFQTHVLDDEDNDFDALPTMFNLSEPSDLIAMISR